MSSNSVNTPSQSPHKNGRPHGAFGKFSARVARLSGAPITFSLALCIIAAWALTGPIFKFNDTWQLVINTGTTIITFLMVFLIQNTQNRDSEALHLKLDELIRSTKQAHNAFMQMEDLSQEELDEIKAYFTKLADSDQDKSD